MAEALDKARAALRDEDAQTRVGGLQLVQSLSLQAALPEVGERLRQDEDLAVRYQAARTLAQFADPASLSSLFQGLRDEDMYVRVQVTSALIHIGAAAVEGLTEALDDRRPAVRRASPPRRWAGWGPRRRSRPSASPCATPTPGCATRRRPPCASWATRRCRPCAPRWTTPTRRRTSRRLGR